MTAPALPPKTRALHLSVVLSQLDRLRGQGLCTGPLREKLLDFRDAVRDEMQRLENGKTTDEVAP